LNINLKLVLIKFKLSYEISGLWVQAVDIVVFVRTGCENVSPNIVGGLRYGELFVIHHITSSCFDMKESLFISSLIDYINSGPTLPPKSLFKRGPCCVFLLMASSRHIILGLYH
jgi:hypothetical protein